MRQNAKRKRASAACPRCRVSKTRCSEYRPCSKCKKLGVADTCNSIACFPAVDQQGISATVYPNPGVLLNCDTADFDKHKKSTNGPNNFVESARSTANRASNGISLAMTPALPPMSCRACSKPASAITIDGPFSTSLYQSPSPDLQGFSHLTERFPNLMAAPQSHRRYPMEDQATLEMLRRGLHSDPLQASSQFIQPAIHPMLQAQLPPQVQYPNSSLAPQLSSISLPHAISALLGRAAGPVPTPQPESDALRLILALAAAAAPLAGPPPPRF